ncbi:caprin-2-like [Mercenaria mercenaria]|uniref:caprin-2-like n=1 Tax=Mercenaria mercenaria TaxID=6596 RepID=UPI001E1D8079|nr:caprin-2-like [Mercenaria mercenaria]
MVRRILCVAAIVSISYGLVLDGDNVPQNRMDALEFMLVEEKQLRMKLEAKVTDLTNRMSSVESSQDQCVCGDGTGSQTRSQPSFMASMSHHMAHCGVQQPVIFDSVKLNKGTAYSPTHGTFTAPVNGTYAFFATLSIPPNNSFHIRMVRNNVANEVGLYLHADHLGIWIERSSNVVLELNKGDEVWMACMYDSQIQGDYHPGTTDPTDFISHFSGFLVN